MGRAMQATMATRGFTRLCCCLSALALLSFIIPSALAEEKFYEFVVQETVVKRLCQTNKIITVNGQFPGPTIEVNGGDTLVIKAVNMAQYNMTLHWHGLRQLRNGWADGPEFVTQCPIRTRSSYTYTCRWIDPRLSMGLPLEPDWLKRTKFPPPLILP